MYWYAAIAYIERETWPVDLNWIIDYVQTCINQGRD